MAPASVAGSEGREGDRNSHGARDVASTEEEHRIRVGTDPCVETGYRNGNRHAGRFAESDCRQETVHRSEKGSSEVVISTESRIASSDFPASPKRSSSLPPSPSQIRRWYDIPGHTRDGVLTEATNDYAGPILPGFRETAWIQKSPYFHRAAKHGVRAYDLYNHMLMPGLYTDPVEEYWHLVNHVTLWDVGVERQVEIDGPDRIEVMQMLKPRDMEECAVRECKYVLLTTPEGGIINDPVLLRLGQNHFWLSLSDWDVIFWCKGVAVNAGLDVIVREPDVSPLQLQGPKSKDVMVDLFGEEILDLEYYHLTETQLDGIPLVIN